MRKFIWIATVAAVLVGLAGITYGQKASGPEDPAAVYAQVQQLEAEIAAVDEEIRGVEHRAERARKALENYEFVQARNEETLKRLADWVESK